MKESPSKMGSYNFLTLILLSVIFFQVRCQKQRTCEFRNSVESPSTKWSLFEHFSTGRCLLVESMGHFPDRKLTLGDCAYSKNPLRQQKIYVDNSTIGGVNLKVDPGMGDKFCLTTKNDILHNAECRSKSFDQSWRFKPVRGNPNQYLIEQYSSKKCLIPSDIRLGASVGLAPCNAFQTEQIWKVCTAK